MTQTRNVMPTWIPIVKDLTIYPKGLLIGYLFGLTLNPYDRNINLKIVFG